MVRPPCVDSKGMKKGAWSEEEDNKLRAYVSRYGHWNWRLLPKYAGLARCGKSCRLRWVNYLKPGVKKGNFTKEEEDLIIQLHAHLGNKWSAIATKLPGRTDNEIKNFYHTRIDKHRKRNPSSKKVPEASYKDQVLEGEKAFGLPQSQTAGVDESAILEATSLDNTISPQEFTQPKVDIFQIDINYNPTYPFPLLIEDEFQYPELHYSDSDSSYRSALDWIADDDHSMISIKNVDASLQGSFWGECCEPNYQNQSPTGFYDPLFHECFDYQMDLFS